jgi:hypothetical protein
MLLFSFSAFCRDWKKAKKPMLPPLALTLLALAHKLLITSLLLCKRRKFMSYNFLSAILFFAHTIALLMISGDQYALKMRFVDHVFDEQVIDSLTVKIILPEGAK